MKPYETSILVLVWGFAAGFWLWASGLDVALQNHLHITYNQEFNTLMRTVSLFGMGRLQIFGVVGLAVLFWFIGRRPLSIQLMLVLPAMAMGGVAQTVMKSLIGRPRPKEVLWYGGDFYGIQPVSFDPMFWSMPSGHATSTFLLATWLGLVFPRGRWLFWIVAAGVSCSRFLAVTPHYMGDVVAGAALGTAVAVMAWRVFQGKGWI